MGEKLGEKIFALAALISGTTTFAILLFLLIPSLPLIYAGDFFSVLLQPWNPQAGQYGIYPMLVGTLTVAVLTLSFAFPLSFGCATFIHIEKNHPLSRLLHKIVTLMTGIPSVIYGFVGIFLLVPLLRNNFHNGSGMSLLAASLMLTLLVSPTMILLFCDSFAQVPSCYANAVLALGGSPIQQFIYSTLPGAKTGIFIGSALALGRALGDTLIALMIAGNAIQVPDSIFDSGRTLTAHIALVFAADYESPEFKAIFACALVLYLISSLLALAIRIAHNKAGVTTL